MNLSVLAVNVEVQLNGEIIDFTDAEGNKVEAQILNSRTMVPLRKIFEVLGCEMEWHPDTRTVIAKKGENEIQLQIDNPIAIQKKNGVEKEIKLDAAPVIVNNRTLVPLRFIAESLEKQVGWDASTYTAIIIDYDYFANLIQEKNANLYQFLKNPVQELSFQIEKKYQDTENAGANTNAILAGKIVKKENASNVTLDFSGSDELMQEISEEGWSHLNVTFNMTKESLKMQTENKSLQKILGKNQDEEIELFISDWTVVGTPEDDLAKAISHFFAVEDTKLTVTTFSQIKSDFEKFLDAFIVEGSRVLNSTNVKISRCDFAKFDNLLYENELSKTLTWLNQTLFHYDVIQDEVLYDWSNIKYELKSGNSQIVLKITLENEYNEIVEYHVECFWK